MVNILRFAKRTKNQHTRRRKQKTATGAEEKNAATKRTGQHTTDGQMKYKNIVRNAQQKLSLVQMKLIKNENSLGCVAGERSSHRPPIHGQQIDRMNVV